MKAFEVSVNGKRVCVAGVGGKGGLLMQITLMTSRENGDILLVGRDSSKKLTWIDSELSLGDEVTMRYVEATEVDPSIKSDRNGPPATQL